MCEVYRYYALNGGFINGAIFLVAVGVFHIGLEKMLLFRRLEKSVRTCTLPQRRMLCYGFLHEVFSREEEHSAGYYKNAFREILLAVVPRLESGLDTMATLIQVAPFLGLFGTVAGMIKTFSLITTYGTGNPVILTEGITVSLLTTQAGLLVAFPCMLFHNYLKGKKDTLVREILSQGESMMTAVSGKKGVL
jgi:biopolymer transport protein ExbB